MMHPHTRVQPISDQIGVGVVATHFIPAGTAVYQTDGLDLRIAPNDPRLFDPALSELIECYSYLDPDGTRVVCWDIGKYVNHACTPNTLTTGYGFQIALQDLQPGDEITDDYGIYTDSFGPLLCNEPTCRGHIRSSDFLELVPMWDRKLRPALKQFFNVDQPLMHLIEKRMLRNLRRFVQTGQDYRSIATARNLDTLPMTKVSIPHQNGHAAKVTA